VSYTIGLDLGQAHDYSALVVCESPEGTTPRTYAWRHLQQWSLGTPYSVIAQEAAMIATRVAALPHVRAVTLAVDTTGVGAPVVDLLRLEPLTGVTLVPILITGGDAETRERTGWHVPKRHLVSTVQVILQTNRLRLAGKLKETQTLLHELENFQMKVALSTGHDSYGAWREGTHDDLVLALACALHVAEHQGPPAASLSPDDMEAVWAEEGIRVQPPRVTPHPWGRSRYWN